MRGDKHSNKKNTSLKGRICANINMNNPNNPFVPKGTLLDLQERRRKQFKIAVFCALSVGIVGLTSMLGVQGCKREKPTALDNDFGISTNVAFNVDNSTTPLPTNSGAYNPPIETTLVSNTPPPIEQPQLPPPGGSDYKIAKGDTLGVIAKKNGVSLKALQTANPKLNPNKLKIGDTVVIPPPTPKSVSPAGAAAGADSSAYTVKPGDSLGKIAKTHHTTVNALKAANSLKTERINVGQKLVIPSKAEVAPTAPAVVPVPEPVVAPPTAPAITPVPPTTTPGR